ncbi:interactor of constitutive active ROPs 4 [Amaranthus tricolor]|uniref:interactor of constitutive active ROPs 4 n=1 Tax=Amaranthus tricolor TaxID=29722 RepID=UPI0025885DCD|nr:interactor of constitutive active ROPs 4 [Amaranthus tricolor]
MLRQKGAEGPQKPSPTRARAPRHLRTSSSNSDPLHHRPMTDKSPRIGTQSDPPAHKKKLGTRITDLETQLVQAQHELKSLKHQLSSAETAKKQAQAELHKKGSKIQTVTKPRSVVEIRKKVSRGECDYEVPVSRETDVFEVLVEKKLVEDDVKEMKSQDSLISEEPEKEKVSLCDEAVSRNEELDRLRALIDEKENQMRGVIEENDTLKKELDEAKSSIALDRTREEEMAAKVKRLEENLEVSRAKEGQLKEKLVDTEAAKELLEDEMKRMKVQTEQWRKAADAAASVLAGGVDTKGRMSERCASMDNHFNSIFEAPPISGFGGYVGSLDDDDDAEDSFGGGKKKGSGIRMLGDLWKKKGQK